MTRGLKCLLAPLVVIGAMAFAGEKQALAQDGFGLYAGYPGFTPYSYFGGYPTYGGYYNYGYHYNYSYYYPRPGYSFTYGYVRPAPRVYYYRPPIGVPGFPLPPLPPGCRR